MPQNWLLSTIFLLIRVELFLKAYRPEMFLSTRRQAIKSKKMESVDLRITVFSGSESIRRN